MNQLKAFSEKVQQRQKSYSFCDRHPTFTLALGQTRNTDSYRLLWSIIRHIPLSKLSYSPFLPSRCLLDHNGRSISCKLSLVFVNHSTSISLPLNAYFLGHILLHCSFLETARLRLQDQAGSWENYLAT